jgi:hypothetical protein
MSDNGENLSPRSGAEDEILRYHDDEFDDEDQLTDLIEGFQGRREDYAEHISSLPEHPPYHCYVTRQVFNQLSAAGIVGLIHCADLISTMSVRMKRVDGLAGLPAEFDNLTFIYRGLGEPRLQEALSQTDESTRYFRSRHLENTGAFRPMGIEPSEMSKRLEVTGNSPLEIIIDTSSKLWPTHTNPDDLRPLLPVRNLIIRGLTHAMFRLPFPVLNPEASDFFTEAKYELAGKLMSANLNAVVLVTSEPGTHDPISSASSEANTPRVDGASPEEQPEA